MAVEKRASATIPALIPGPALLLARASAYLSGMLFAYLDEFGHQGPFVHRQDKRYKDSPVFGLAGIILPEAAIRPFSTQFLKLKENALAEDLAKAGVHVHHWEKKGSDLFRPKALEKYPEIRKIGFRLLNTINNYGGKIFYCGREKQIGRIDGNANGLYTTVLSHAIRQIDTYAGTKKANFALVVDQHSARKELLECAAKTMFGENAARHLVSPPFEVESYLNQNIQAADWVAAIVGRLWAYRILPDQFCDHANVEKYFGARIAAIQTHSTVHRRPEKRQAKLKLLETEVASMKPATLRYSINDGEKKKKDRDRRP